MWGQNQMHQRICKYHVEHHQVQEQILIVWKMSSNSWQLSTGYPPELSAETREIKRASFFIGDCMQARHRFLRGPCSYAVSALGKAMSCSVRVQDRFIGGATAQLAPLLRNSASMYQLCVTARQYQQSSA